MSDKSHEQKMAMYEDQMAGLFDAILDALDPAERARVVKHALAAPELLALLDRAESATQSGKAHQRNSARWEVVANEQRVRAEAAESALAKERERLSCGHRAEMDGNDECVSCSMLRAVDEASSECQEQEERADRAESALKVATGDAREFAETLIVQWDGLPRDATNGDGRDLVLSAITPPLLAEIARLKAETVSENWQDIALRAETWRAKVGLAEQEVADLRARLEAAERASFTEIARLRGLVEIWQSNAEDADQGKMTVLVDLAAAREEIERLRDAVKEREDALDGQSPNRGIGWHRG